MRFAAIFVALASVAVASASVVNPLLARQGGGFPPCSVPCLGQGDLGGCAITDNTCLCKNQAYIASTTKCISAACSNPADLQTAEKTSVALCKAAGVDISTATGASATAASTPKSSSAASVNVVGKGAVLGGLAAVVALAL